MLHKITLLSRPKCELCDEVREMIEKLVTAHTDVLVEEVDIDQNEDLRDQYTDAVPVILVDGKERFRGPVDPDALAKLFYDEFSQKWLGF